MRTAVSDLELLQPHSLRDALALLAGTGVPLPLAGGTDLYVALNAGTLQAQRFLNLWQIPHLRRIEQRDAVLSIGALATFTGLIRSSLVKRRLPMLLAAAREVGGVQIQNRATIGGNVANASPAGDSLPVLAVAQAAVVLQSAAGERRVPFAEFYTGYRQTVRGSDELITHFEIPPVGHGQWFRKVGTRAAQAISKVVMAAVRGPEPRIALGSVGPTVLRLYQTEAALSRGEGIDAAVRVMEAEIRPIDDLRSTAEYRRRVAGNLLRHWWAETAGSETAR